MHLYVKTTLKQSKPLPSFPRRDAAVQWLSSGQTEPAPDAGAGRGEVRAPPAAAQAPAPRPGRPRPPLGAVLPRLLPPATADGGGGASAVPAAPTTLTLVRGGPAPSALPAAAPGGAPPRRRRHAPLTPRLPPPRLLRRPPRAPAAPARRRRRPLGPAAARRHGEQPGGGRGSGDLQRTPGRRGAARHPPSAPPALPAGAAAAGRAGPGALVRRVPPWGGCRQPHREDLAGHACAAASLFSPPGKLRGACPRPAAEPAGSAGARLGPRSAALAHPDLAARGGCRSRGRAGGLRGAQLFGAASCLRWPGRGRGAG